MNVQTISDTRSGERGARESTDVPPWAGETVDGSKYIVERDHPDNAGSRIICGCPLCGDDLAGNQWDQPEEYSAEDINRHLTEDCPEVAGALYQLGEPTTCELPRCGRDREFEVFHPQKGEVLNACERHTKIITQDAGGRVISHE